MPPRWLTSCGAPAWAAEHRPAGWLPCFARCCAMLGALHYMMHALASWLHFFCRNQLSSSLLPRFLQPTRWLPRPFPYAGWPANCTSKHAQQTGRAGGPFSTLIGTAFCALMYQSCTLPAVPWPACASCLLSPPVLTVRPLSCFPALANSPAPHPPQYVPLTYIITSLCFARPSASLDAALLLSSLDVLLTL